jgi:hypothetical protein
MKGTMGEGGEANGQRVGERDGLIDVWMDRQVNRKRMKA